MSGLFCQVDQDGARLKYREVSSLSWSTIVGMRPFGLSVDTRPVSAHRRSIPVVEQCSRVIHSSSIIEALRPFGVAVVKNVIMMLISKNFPFNLVPGCQAHNVFGSLLDSDKLISGTEAYSTNADSSNAYLHQWSIQVCAQYRRSDHYLNCSLLFCMTKQNSTARNRFTY